MPLMRHIAAEETPRTRLPAGMEVYHLHGYRVAERIVSLAWKWRKMSCNLEAAEWREDSATCWLQSGRKIASLAFCRVVGRMEAACSSLQGGRKK